MARWMERVLAPVAGTNSPLAGRFLWQLDDQTRRLTEHTRGATAAELCWQAAPGMNTIGMLLAHVAVVEIGWVVRGVLDRPFEHADALFPLRWADPGVPLAPGGAPPELLRGRTLEYFDDLLARARRFTKQALAPLTDADLERRLRFALPWMEDTEMEVNGLWTLYHLLEHEAGHYGQINLLRHHYRLGAGETPTP